MREPDDDDDQEEEASSETREVHLTLARDVLKHENENVLNYTEKSNDK